MSILVGAHDDADNVNDLPDEETSGGDQLNDAGDDSAGVEAVQTSQTEDEKEAGKDESNGARAG